MSSILPQPFEAEKFTTSLDVTDSWLCDGIKFISTVTEIDATDLRKIELDDKVIIKAKSCNVLLGVVSRPAQPSKFLSAPLGSGQTDFRVTAYCYNISNYLLKG